VQLNSGRCANNSACFSRLNQSINEWCECHHSALGACRTLSTPERAFGISLSIPLHGLDWQLTRTDKPARHLGVSILSLSLSLFRFRLLVLDFQRAMHAMNA